MTERLISRRGKYKVEFDLAMARSGHRCEVRWGADLEPCRAPATEVWEESGPRFTAMCRDCRQRSVGSSIDERRRATTAFQKAQAPLFKEPK